MQFSPLLVTSSILAPLRYYFSNYAKEGGLVWHPDEKVRTIEIGDIHDFNKIALNERPRILVGRGQYQVNKTGLSDSMAEGISVDQGRGLRKDVHMYLYSGVASVLIEARNKGTCELVTDMATHFLAWSRGPICDTQGFKQFADTLNVTECQPTGDNDDQVFQVQVQVPYMKEEHWVMRDDGVLLKSYITDMIPKS